MAIDLKRNASSSQLYHDAEDYILGLITGPPSPPPDTPPEEIRQRAIDRIERMRAFLEFIGNPQRQFRAIHIGGTSGKGSTAALTASILHAAGYRTGLHVSPYLQVSTEKLVINDRIVAADRYNQLVKALAGRVEEWVAAGNDPLAYGEFWVALTFLFMAKEEIEVGVIEVGAGGRFDLTNVIEPEVVAITSIGLDHTVTLGDTLESIAWHKAGIIKAGTVAVTAVQDDEPLAVIRAEAEAVGASLFEVRAGETYQLESTGANGTSFVDMSTGKSFHVVLPGRFQASNAATAIAITRAFDPSSATDDAIQQGLEATRFPGRMEIVQQEPLVILDGAHNPQKIAGLAADLCAITSGKRVIAVFGVLESKNHQEMIAALAPRVDVLVATTPRVYAKPAITAAEIAERARSRIDDVRVEPDPLAAVATALSIATADDAVIVTGSLYLVGNVRERWYPSEQILAQGTLWPSARQSESSPPAQ